MSIDQLLYDIWNYKAKKAKDKLWFYEPLPQFTYYRTSHPENSII